MPHASLTYPKTPHLPWSTYSCCDRKLYSTHWFYGKPVVVTETLAGARVIISDSCIEFSNSDGILKPAYASMQSRLAKNVRVLFTDISACKGAYPKATSLIFMSAAAVEDVIISWVDTELLAKFLGVPTCPVLYLGEWDTEAVKACGVGESALGGEKMGYKVRVQDIIPTSEYAVNAAKFTAVRSTCEKTCKDLQECV